MFLFYAVNMMFIPVCILFFGWWFVKGHPKKVNYLIGYRSKWSLKNIRTWRFAHNYFGKCWFYIGLLMTTITVIVLFLARHSSDQEIENIFLVFIVIEIILLLLPIIPTEIKIRETFDQFGQEKE